MQPEEFVTSYANWAPTQSDTRGLGLPDRQDWLVCPTSRTRDSGPLEQSNFAAMLDCLGGESDTVEVHRFGHWGPGWFEVILVHPQHAVEVGKAVCALSDYPILDDMDFSAREYECAYECWESYGADDMRAHLQEEHDVSEEQAESLTADQLWECHSENSPVPYECDESDSCSFDFDYLTHDHVAALLGGAEC